MCGGIRSTHLQSGQQILGLAVFSTKFHTFMVQSTACLQVAQGYFHNSVS